MENVKLSLTPPYRATEVTYKSKIEFEATFNSEAEALTFYKKLVIFIELNNGDKTNA